MLKQIAETCQGLARGRCSDRSATSSGSATTNTVCIDHEYRLYSFRRGGATYDFGHHGQLDRAIVRGRWSNSRTARLYTTEGLAMLGDQRLSPASKSALATAASFWRRPDLGVLEADARAGPAGSARRVPPPNGVFGRPVAIRATAASRH